MSSPPFDPTASTTPGTVMPETVPPALPAALPAKKKGGISKGCMAALGCGLCLGMFGVVIAGGAAFYFLRAGSAVTTVGGPVAVYAPPDHSVDDYATETPPEAQPSPRQTAAPPKPRAQAQATVRPEPTARAARTVLARAERTPVVPAPLPWDDSGKATPAAATTAAPVSTAAAFPASTPVKSTPVNPNARVIHSRAGDKTVDVNRNVAITGSDGKTLVGVLVNVANGYVDIRVKGQLMRIAEQDVTDAASY